MNDSRYLELTHPSTAKTLYAELTPPTGERMTPQFNISRLIPKTRSVSRASLFFVSALDSFLLNLSTRGYMPLSVTENSGMEGSLLFSIRGVRKDENSTSCPGPMKADKSLVW